MADLLNKHPRITTAEPSSTHINGHDSNIAAPQRKRKEPEASKLNSTLYQPRRNIPLKIWKAKIAATKQARDSRKKQPGPSSVPKSDHTISPQSNVLEREIPSPSQYTDFGAPRTDPGALTRECIWSKRKNRENKGSQHGKSTESQTLALDFDLPQSNQSGVPQVQNSPKQSTHDLKYILKAPESDYEVLLEGSCPSPYLIWHNKRGNPAFLTQNIRPRSSGGFGGEYGNNDPEYIALVESAWREQGKFWGRLNPPAPQGKPVPAAMSRLDPIDIRLYAQQITDWCFFLIWTHFKDPEHRIPGKPDDLERMNEEWLPNRIIRKVFAKKGPSAGSVDYTRSYYRDVYSSVLFSVGGMPAPSEAVPYLQHLHKIEEKMLWIETKDELYGAHLNGAIQNLFTLFGCKPHKIGTNTKIEKKIKGTGRMVLVREHPSCLDYLEANGYKSIKMISLSENETKVYGYKVLEQVIKLREGRYIQRYTSIPHIARFCNNLMNKNKDWYSTFNPLIFWHTGLHICDIAASYPEYCQKKNDCIDNSTLAFMSARRDGHPELLGSSYAFLSGKTLYHDAFAVGEDSYQSEHELYFSEYWFNNIHHGWTFPSKAESWNGAERQELAVAYRINDYMPFVLKNLIADEARPGKKYWAKKDFIKQWKIAEDLEEKYPRPEFPSFERILNVSSEAEQNKNCYPPNEEATKPIHKGPMSPRTGHHTIDDAAMTKRSCNLLRQQIWSYTWPTL
ncbi:hypothetical protein B0O99DRAFT_707792 [Bisporella sp. PMI_857]|nr:hypothetical protein B0O99DRAFT_707792 [Bisporella sp. PMI_857]